MTDSLPVERPISSLTRAELSDLARCRAYGVMWEAASFSCDRVHQFLHQVAGICVQEEGED